MPVADEAIQRSHLQLSRAGRTHMESFSSISARSTIWNGQMPIWMTPLQSARDLLSLYYQDTIIWSKELTFKSEFSWLINHSIVSGMTMATPVEIGVEITNIRLRQYWRVKCVEYELNMMPRAMMCNLVNSSLQYRSFPRLNNTSHAHTHSQQVHKLIIRTKKISNKLCLLLMRARPINYCKTTQIFTRIGSIVKQRLLNVTADSQFCAEIAFR